jgi:hypothetical protein
MLMGSAQSRERLNPILQSRKCRFGQERAGRVGALSADKLFIADPANRFA